MSNKAAKRKSKLIKAARKLTHSPNNNRARRDMKNHLEQMVVDLLAEHAPDKNGAIKIFRMLATGKSLLSESGYRAFILQVYDVLVETINCKMFYTEFDFVVDLVRTELVRMEKICRGITRGSDSSNIEIINSTTAAATNVIKNEIKQYSVALKRRPKVEEKKTTATTATTSKQLSKADQLATDIATKRGIIAPNHDKSSREKAHSSVEVSDRLSRLCYATVFTKENRKVVCSEPRLLVAFMHWMYDKTLTKHQIDWVRTSKSDVRYGITINEVDLNNILDSIELGFVKSI